MLPAIERVSYLRFLATFAAFLVVFLVAMFNLLSPFCKIKL